MVTTTSNGRANACIALRATTVRTARCAANSSPAATKVIRRSRLMATSTLKSTPERAATARMPSWTGLPSTTPQRARGLPIISASCSRMMVRKPASPGATILGPPLKPAKKCGSTNPVVMRTSASTQVRFSHTGMPPSTSPRDTSRASSKASWTTMRLRSTTSAPSISTSSSRVVARCVPLAIRIAMRSAGTCDRASSTTGSTVALGMGRVTSQTEMATVWPRPTRSRRGALPTGFSIARRTAPAWSGRPSTQAGSRTVVRPSGNSTGSPVRP